MCLYPMKSKHVTICSSNPQLEEGLLSSVSTQGNWFETVARGDPVSKELFNERPPCFALTNVSKTINILVLCTASLMTALCGT